MRSAWWQNHNDDTENHQESSMTDQVTPEWRNKIHAHQPNDDDKELMGSWPT